MFSHKFLFIITLTLVALFSSSLVALAAPDVPVVSYIRTWPIGSTEADMDLGQRWTADDIGEAGVQTRQLISTLMQELHLANY